MRKDEVMNKEQIFQKILYDAKQAVNTVRPGVDCPAGDVLVDYVCKDLSAEKNSHITSHLHSCDSCRMMVLRLEADQVLWNEMLEGEPGMALAHALGSAGRKEVKSLVSRTVKKQSAFISKIKETIVTWTSPLWQPLYAGEAVTAADIPEQTIRFDMDYGEYINLSCHWQDEKDTQPCIDLSWQANLLQPSCLWARFVDPDSSTILKEILLGSELEGRVRIIGSDLNFNPTTDKWAIAIIVKES